MICIAYLSTAVRPPEVAEIEAILAASQARNAAAGVTGLLCHHDGSFLQFLEGEAPAVEATYARIARDERHHSLLRISNREIERRLFPDWTMALARPDALGAEHRQFAQGLRELQLSGAEDDVRAVAPLLAIFRAWLR